MDQCASVVELTISCRNLPDMDVLSKSDPICVVFLKDPSLEVWKEIGRTEIIWDNLNPEFSKKITMTYMFEQRQLLKFELYDIDAESSDLDKHDFLGRLEVTLGEIVATAGLQHFERPLIGGPHSSKPSTIKVLAEEVSSCKEEYHFNFDAQRLPKRFFGQNSFFYEIHKSTEQSGFSLVYRSPTVKANKAQCEWPQITLNMYSLCNGDMDRNIKLTLRKYKSNGSHRIIGEANSTVRGMSESTKTGNKLTFNMGSSVLRLSQFSKGSHSSFLDFIRVG